MLIIRNKNLFLIASISFAFAVYLSSLPMEPFVDRANYLNFATYIEVIIGNRLDKGFFGFLFNEPLFALIMLTLRYFLSAEGAISVIIGFSTFSVFFLVLSNVPKKYLLLAVLILLLPQVLKNHIIHLRQGLAIAIFLWGWFSNNRNYKLLFFVLAALTHSSFLIIVSGLALIIVVQKVKLLSSFKYLIYTASGLGVGLFGLAIAGALNARQAEGYEEFEVSSSGLAFVFWLCILLLYLSQGKYYAKKHAAALFFIILYLTTYFFIPVTGRIFESCLIIVLLASADLKRERIFIFYALYLFYFSYLWYLRFPRPGFGWYIS